LQDILKIAGGKKMVLKTVAERILPTHIPKAENAQDQSRYEQDRQKVEAGFWKKFNRVMRHIPFAEEALASFYCARVPQTPFHVRATLCAALAYFLLPFDIIPDVFIIAGFTDDAAVLMAALSRLGDAIQPSHREAAKAYLRKETQ